MGELLFFYSNILGYAITFGSSFNFTSFMFICPLELGEHKIHGWTTKRYKGYPIFDRI